MAKIRAHFPVFVSHGISLALTSGVASLGRRSGRLTTILPPDGASTCGPARHVRSSPGLLCSRVPRARNHCGLVIHTAVKLMGVAQPSLADRVLLSWKLAPSLPFEGRMWNPLHTAGADAPWTRRLVPLFAAVFLSSYGLATAQPTQADNDVSLALVPQQRPITPQERRKWFVEGALGPKALGTGLVMGAWQTAVDSPEEWQGSSGFTKRVLTYDADNGISKGIEASLGVLWGEDPRPVRSRRDDLGGRLGFAIKTVVLAPRSDGHLGPAWGRYAGAVGSNVAKNAWLPSRLTTPKETARRIAAGLVGRLAMNMWQEFGPDLRRRFMRGRAAKTFASDTAASTIPAGVASGDQDR
jgi:hypothetical protein